MKRIWSHLKSRKGFTLIELIIVVIIVGVLAAVSLPQYAGFVERARTTDAVNAIGAIKIAEQTARIETGLYVNCANAVDITANLGIAVDATNWRYATMATAGDTVEIWAIRRATNGGTDGDTIIFTWTNASQTGVWTGTHPNRPR